MKANTNAAREAVQAEPCPNDRLMLALQCTWDIEGIASAVTQMAEEVGAEGDIKTEALLRCYGMRIATLNSQVISYLGGEKGVTEQHMHKAIFGRLKELEGAEA